jgi:hypothetical protein
MKVKILRDYPPAGYVKDQVLDLNDASAWHAINRSVAVQVHDDSQPAQQPQQVQPQVAPDKVVIPDDWRSKSRQDVQLLASSIAQRIVRTRAEADTIIEDELKRRAASA